jgi:hypothetical protein
MLRRVERHPAGTLEVEGLSSPFMRSIFCRFTQQSYLPIYYITVEVAVMNRELLQLRAIHKFKPQDI